MQYSYQWLQEHLAKPLPPVDVLRNEITMKAFEVEEVKQVGTDTIFEIKVLPDRAHDALSHRGMAKEIAVLFALPMKGTSGDEEIRRNTSVPAVAVEIQDPTRCFRYVGTRVDGVRVEPTPEWLKQKLEAIGARSINTIVDVTNFILFDLGQPMHVFDAAKVKGGITVRRAMVGETMTTLDGKELVFDGTELVIADDDGPIALAGIKGGKRAEVDAGTTSIIFESAHFDPVTTRKTSLKHHMKTDASKRFENGITSTLAPKAMEQALRLLATFVPNARIGVTTDDYPKREEAPRAIAITIDELNRYLGTTMVEDDVHNILSRMGNAGFTWEVRDRTFLVTPPYDRLDVTITEDLIEEIGRHYGYEQIIPILPQLKRKGIPHKRLYYANKVRALLVSRGYAEVLTYSFAAKGDGEIEVLNPVGKDRPLVRRELSGNMLRALQKNYFHAPLLGRDEIKMFEIGNIFTQQGERMHLSIGVEVMGKKRFAVSRSHLHDLAQEIATLHGATLEHLTAAGMVWNAESSQGSGSYGCVYEFNFDALIQHLPQPNAFEPLNTVRRTIQYRPCSSYPFIVRDISLWVPLSTEVEDVERVIRANAGELAQRIYHFDTFEKEGRKSLAFRIVLQSFERTLEDAEANIVYDRVADALQSANKEWEVRV